METSLLLAKLIGPTMLVFGLFVLIRREQMQQIGREFLDSEALLFMSGVITLPVGLAIVVTHNVWVADWRVLITLFGWIAIIAGIARISLPDMLQSAGRTMLEKPTMLIAVPGVVMVLVGAWLAWHGYFA